MFATLAGYKTYITGVLALAGILGAYLAGTMTAVEAIGAAFVAIQTMNLRSGMASEAAKAASGTAQG